MLNKVGFVSVFNFIVEILEPMVRHEAGEALGAIGDKSVLELLKKYSEDPLPEVAETCQLAYQRIEWVHEEGKNTNSPYDSVGTCIGWKSVKF